MQLNKYSPKKGVDFNNINPFFIETNLLYLIVEIYAQYWDLINYEVSYKEKLYVPIAQ